MDKKDIKSMTMEELTEDFLSMGEKKFRLYRAATERFLITGTDCRKRKKSVIPL